MDSYAWFKAWFSERRHMDGDAAREVSMTAGSSPGAGDRLKLIDELGDEKTAIAWLAKEKNIDAKIAGA